MSDWLFLTEKVAKRVDPWRGKFTSSGCKLVLINSCLTSLPTFAMGLFLLTDDTHNEMDKVRARFFWKGTGLKCRYHMVKLVSICKPKDYGGLGVINTKLMKKALTILISMKAGNLGAGALS